MVVFAKKTVTNCFLKETGQKIRVTGIEVTLGDVLCKFSVDDAGDIFHEYIVSVQDKIVLTTKVLRKPIFEFAINNSVFISRNRTSTVGNLFSVPTDILLHFYVSKCSDFPPWNGSVPRSFFGNKPVLPGKVVFLKRNNKIYTYDRITLLEKMVHRVPLRIPGLKKKSQAIMFNLNLSAVLCTHKKPLIIIDLQDWGIDDKWSRFMYPDCIIPRDLERL
jgi:hypothetical protein